MTQIQNEIRKARPRLKAVAPLSHWIVVIFASLNLVLGLGLFFAIDQRRVTASFIIVNDVFNFHFWGVLFTCLGVFMFYALRVNDWSYIKKAFVLGVCIKASWALALIVRVLISPGSIMITSLWVALACIQIATYIYFVPPIALADKLGEVKHGRKK